MLEREDNGADAPVENDARPADAGAAAPTTARTVDDDIDAADLAEARRIAALEESGEQDDQQTDPAPATAPASEPAKPQPGPIPYERFSEVNNDLKKTREELAYLQGQMDAMQAQMAGKAPATDTAPAAQPQPSVAPTDAIQAHRASVKEAAAKFDSGEITLTEFEEVRAAAEDAIAELNVQRAAQAAAARQVQQPGFADEAILANHAARLNEEHPYLTAMSGEQLMQLRAMAMAGAQAAGRPYGPGPAETMRLRQDVANLSDKFGPDFVPDFKPTARPSATTTPKTGGGQNLSPSAQARMAKMGMAAAMPPDTSGMGSAGNEDPYSEARIAAMSDEEIAALPASTRARILSR